jgi:hypothetical protein
MAFLFDDLAAAMAAIADRLAFHDPEDRPLLGLT